MGRGYTSTRGGLNGHRGSITSAVSEPPTSGREVRDILASRHRQESIDEAFALIDRHSEGGDLQAAADERLFSLINDKDSETGAVLRDMSRIDTFTYESKLKKEVDSYMAKEKSYRQEYDTSSGYYKSRYGISTEDEYLHFKGMYGAPKDISVYRGGNSKKVEAWTLDPMGADVGGGIRIEVNNESSVRKMLKSHYMIGFSRMVGAPGESEIMFIKKRKK